MGFTPKQQRDYIKILSSDGTFRLPAQENEPGAVRREYETSDGKKGVKWEHVMEQWDGKINGVSFRDSDYGQTLELATDDGVFSLNTDHNYAQDLMAKLPNIDFDKDVTLRPYSFEDEKKKLRRGVSVEQEGEKIKSFFYDPEKKKSINGVPEVSKKDAEGYDKDDWKMHFIKVRKFLVKYIEDNVAPKFDGAVSTDDIEGEEI